VHVTSLPRGFRVGHWSDHVARTGCTVILPPAGNVASCEIRGSSPGSRELELLHPDRKLTEVHAILLTGGSAFGLAAADGVATWLEERGIGYETGAGVVPIVPAAVVFDLGVGRSNVRPGASEGRAACEAATGSHVESGRVGAGAGATVGKWAGREHAADGGVGSATAGQGALSVSALAVVNSIGDVVDEDGSVVAGTQAEEPRYEPPLPPEREAPVSTVLAVVMARASLDKRDMRWLAARGADGITVSVRPAHTRYDGDVVFAVSAPAGEDQPAADLDVLGQLATRAVASAVRNAVRAENR
jgi:L-aminopeptidase/D-esterase-like protein